MTYRKKLIEVALPLEAINMESAREKSIRHGHPSTLHLWWARRPLAACRAVLWSSLVDDPSSWPEKFPTEEAQKRERQRLFDILGRITIETDRKGKEKQKVRGLVSWDDIKDPAVIEEAQREIARSLAWGRGEEPPTKPDAVREYIAQYAPPVYDPFAGGGSIPLEAQRLGLEAHASDLNPVAVLINKALIEIPPKFKDMPPVNPEDRQRAKLESWKGAQGLAADVRYYGKWMRDEAFKRIGHLYPPVQVVRQEDGTYRHATESEIANPKSKIEELTVIAWIWARTVKCPNPACGCEMPLVKSFEISRKKGSQAWIDLKIDRESLPPKINYSVKQKNGKPLEGTMNRKGAVCVCCNTPVPFEYIRLEGQANRMSAKMMAIVAESQRGRICLPSTPVQEDLVEGVAYEWKPNAPFPNNKRDIRPQLYGMPSYGDIFSLRQLKMLNTFVQLTKEVREKIIGVVKQQNDSFYSADYSESITSILGIMTSKLTVFHNSLSRWRTGENKSAPAFGRHAIPVVWDYAEVNQQFSI